MKFNTITESISHLRRKCKFYRSTGCDNATAGKPPPPFSEKGIAQQKVFQPIFKVKAVDTTAAGDTFTGYFLAGLADGLPMEEVLRMSAKASSIAVTREGAVPSIPYRAEVLEALQA